VTREELARRLEVPVGTVKSWLRRSLERLQKCLEG
jgi:RNA polymerase sigma-70 factor (ECF subfamily)